LRYIGSRLVLSAADHQTFQRNWAFSAEASGLLHQKRLDPVVVALLADPIRDGYRYVGHLEPLAEGPGEAVQQGPGEAPQGVVEVLDRLGIEGHQARVGRS
jgi:hypothetical protein